MRMNKDKSESQRNYYDHEVKYYAGLQDREDFHQALLTELFIRKLNTQVKTGRILEIGAGTGMYTLPLLKAGYAVTALDVSDASLRECKRRAVEAGLDGRLELIHAAAEDFEIDEKFDAVVGKHILHHLADIPLVVSHLFASLRPGGVLLFMEPNPLCPLWAIFISVNIKRKWDIEKGIYRCFAGQLQNIFEHAGFEKVSFDYCGFIPGFLVRRFPWMGKLNFMFSSIPVVRKVLALQIVTGVKPQCRDGI